ncbi:hypothetical protein JCM9157_1777 [Halalkalibacter akibai JCM 9157]|uniref:Uncharacterized protein n=1 Tax=Halalkalibacter akibai (strain ATCC 43226 / DSM 21942 / CIP 109018 / JCM 9157 / 1139) TaxID=1236973 RepID=W4QSU0_HALA3|nr:hypothetical protein JCM9157_1777 [Halalkalibacter akibai JCM 9157]
MTVGKGIEGIRMSIHLFNVKYKNKYGFYLRCKEKIDCKTLHEGERKIHRQASKDFLEVICISFIGLER